MSDYVYDPRKISGMMPVVRTTGEEWLEVIQENPLGEYENRKIKINQLVGPAGPAGQDGKSAYELAVMLGRFQGTLTEYLESLKGADGSKGDKGDKGDKGLSAYEVAVAYGGFNGNMTEWLESLKGLNGKNAYELAVQQGATTLSLNEWLASLKGERGDIGPQGPMGPAGLNAYDVAVTYNGYQGSVQDWLDSLRGDKGDTGPTGPQGPQGPQGELGPVGPVGLKGDKGEIGPVGPSGSSAYQIATQNGYPGTETEWLVSLRGEKGDTGPQGPQGIAGPKGDTGDTGLTGPMGPKGDAGPQGPQGLEGPRGYSNYDIAVQNGYTGTQEQFLSEVKGTAVKIVVNSFLSLDYTSIQGFTLSKEYSDSSVRIRHNLGIHPSGWFVVNHNESGPSVGIYPSSTQNIQIIDENEVIITNIGNYETFDIYLYFDQRVEVSGVPGDSAYEIAVANGFVGTQTDWLSSLVGPQGPAGIDGVPGPQGPEGRNAYDIAVDNGFVGTEAEFIQRYLGKSFKIDVVSFASFDVNIPTDFTVEKAYSDSSIKITHNLGASPHSWSGVSKGTSPEVAIYANSTTNMQILDENNVIITNIANLETFEIFLHFGDQVEVTGSGTGTGTDGKSAYEIAVENGFVGSETDWLNSLVGPQGQQGIAGPAGIKGDTGDTGPMGPQGPAGEDGKSLSINGVEITNVTISGSGVNVTETAGEVDINIPGGGSTGGAVGLVKSLKSASLNGITAEIIVMAYGEQTLVDEITATAVDNGTSVSLVFDNVDPSVKIKTISVNYEPGFVTSSAFEIIYPEPYGSTNELEMAIPSLVVYNYASPAVTQPATNIYFSLNASNKVVLGKSALNPGQGFRWRFNTL